MDSILRGIELGVGLALKLGGFIAEALDAGHNEEEATRKALARLATHPDLAATLPKVRMLLADARRPRAERDAIAAHADHAVRMLKSASISVQDREALEALIAHAHAGVVLDPDARLGNGG